MSLASCFPPIGTADRSSRDRVLNAVSTSHQLPLAAGCVIIAILTLLPAFAGYKVVHMYERYAAIIPFVVFCFIAGETGKYVEVGPFGGSGKAEAGSVLSFAAAIVGFGIGWVSYAADYTVNLQHDTPGWKIFFTTYLGLNIPLILIEILGAAVMTTLTQKTTWYDRAYPDGTTELEIGGLIAATLSPMNGFGGFLCVLAALSIIANNIPNLVRRSAPSQFS